jgi:hypothetical protein
MFLSQAYVETALLLGVLDYIRHSVQVAVKEPDQLIYHPVNAASFFLAITLAPLQGQEIEPFDLTIVNLRSLTILQPEIKIVSYDQIDTTAPGS